MKRINLMCCPIRAFFIIFLILSNNFPAFSQENPLFISTIKLVKEIENDETLKLKFVQYEKYQNQLYKTKDTTQNELNSSNNPQLWLSYTKAAKISDYFYTIESSNFSMVELTSQSNQIIQAFSQLDGLVLILKFVQDQNFSDNAHNQLVRKKLIHAISLQMQLIAENTQAWYNYSTVEKKWIKGVQFESANDLFKFGLYQKNNDMDYTGMLKFSFITDMFKLDAGRPNQSYQAITYGGEVFTPYFKDTNIFIIEDTFNIYDRPHGSFQYFGFENQGISEAYKSRWSTNIRVGLIGGRFGYNFQYWLHRDISASPYPTGWDAQVAFPGRIALQVNVKYERLFLKKQTNHEGAGFKIIPSYSGEVAIGHYMTYLELGLTLSTRNFKHKNRNSVLPQTQYHYKSERLKKIRLFGDLEGSARLVGHNTMLEGFGVFKTVEKENDTFAPTSIYKLDKNRIKPLVFFVSATGGIQFRNINLFYRYNIKSPEYKSNGLIYTDLGTILDPNKRWQHFGTIGLAFIL